MNDDKLMGWLPRRKKTPSSPYAGFNRRMLAVTVDSLLLMPFVVPFCERFFPINGAAIQEVLGQQLQEGRATFGGFLQLLYSYGWFGNAVAQMVIFCIASGICWHFWSATPGKMLFRMKIVDANSGKPMAGWQILLRMLGYVVSTAALTIGIFWIGIDKRRQGWHDKMARTVVVTIPWKTKSGPAAADPSNCLAPSTEG